MLCFAELLSFACQLRIAHYDPTPHQAALTEVHAAKPKAPWLLPPSSDIGYRFAALLPEIAHGRRTLNV
jgi:hypothetical protein